MEAQSMPHNTDAERAILGAILLDQTALYPALEVICQDDLYNEAHRHIFAAMQALRGAESPIDQLSLKSELEKSGKLEQAGGTVYIVNLTEGLPRGINIRHYAGLVREQYIRRRVIQLASDAIERCADPGETAAGTIESLQAGLLKLTVNDKRHRWIKSDELMTEAFREIESIARRQTATSGIDTGFSDLNRLTQGFKSGQFILIAGRPGHGKTSIAMNMASHAILRQSLKVAVFSIEMTALELAKRLLYSEAEIDSYRAGAGYLNREDWVRLNQSASEIANTRLFVDEAGALTIHDVRSRLQQLAVEHGIDMVIIDYLQLMSGSGNKKDPNRVQEITEISRGLKTIAKDLNIPIIAVSQLNRQVESENRKPRLSDLRESGSLEQDADLVLFIWREELKKRTPDNEGRAELIIGKQRSGPVGQTIELQFRKNFTKFVQLTTHAETEDQEQWYQK